MRRLRLITGNPRKVEEYRRYAAEAGIALDLEPLAVDLPEMQEEDPLRLMESKVAVARVRTALPFIIDDASFWSERYPGLPGNYAKFMNRSAGVEGLCRLFEEGDRVAAVARIALSYLGETVLFEGRVDGRVTFRRAAEADPKMPWNDLLEVDDTGKTLGECLKDPSFSNHRRRAFVALLEWIRARQDEDENSGREAATRWDGRANEWNGTAADPSSFVNHENAYGRFETLARRCAPVLHGEVLDVGCGTGLVTRLLAERPEARVTGIDISAAMIEEARREVPQASFVTAQPKDLIGKRFDAIVSRGVVLSLLPRHEAVDFLRDLDTLANDGAYALFDWIQNPENGDFPPTSPLGVFAREDVEAIMRELGWVPVDGDGGPRSRLRIGLFHKPKPGTVFFATGNPRKLEELTAALGTTSRPLAYLHADVDEIKSDSLERIVEDKLRKAYALVRRPVICTDGGIFIEALHGFPGENSKQAAEKLGSEGLLRLMEGKTDRRAFRRNAVGYFDGREFRVSVAEVTCDLAEGPRAAHPSYEMDRILVPRVSGNEAGRTYAEMPVEERVRFTELPQSRSFIETILQEEPS